MANLPFSGRGPALSRNRGGRRLRKRIARRMMLERLEQRALLATLYWDPDRIATNNVVATGAGLGGSGGWSEGGAAVWFNPALNGGAGGYVSWNSSVGDTAVFTGPPAARSRYRATSVLRGSNSARPDSS